MSAVGLPALRKESVVREVQLRKRERAVEEREPKIKEEDR